MDSYQDSVPAHVKAVMGRVTYYVVWDYIVITLVQARYVLDALTSLRMPLQLTSSFLI